MSDETDEAPEELAILATSTNYMECPHCGGELFILGQQKVYVSAEPTAVKGPPAMTPRPKRCPHCQGKHWFGNYDHPDHCLVCGGSGVSPTAQPPSKTPTELAEKFRRMAAKAEQHREQFGFLDPGGDRSAGEAAALHRAAYMLEELLSPTADPPSNESGTEH